MADKNKKSRFNIYDFFNSRKDAPGVSKSKNEKRDLKFFFKLYGRNFGRLVTINMYYVFGNFPAIFGLLAFSGYLNNESTAPVSPLFAALHGVSLNGGGSPAFSALLGVHGIQSTISIPSTATLVMWLLCGLMLFTFGPVNVGTTYIIRNIIKGEPIFMWADFWYAVKRNLRQGLILGILDIGVMALLGYDIVFFYFNIGEFLNNVMFYFSLFLALLYIFMRFYMYVLLVTFDLSLFKIFKNSLIFAILGIGRNFGALFGIVFILFVNYSLLLAFVPLGVIMPFVLLFSNCAYTSCYPAFTKVKDIMIDPYYKEEESKTEPIFRDTI